MFRKGADLPEATWEINSTAGKFSYPHLESKDTKRPREGLLVLKKNRELEGRPARAFSTTQSVHRLIQRALGTFLG